MKKVIAYTIADDNNLKYYEMLKNSLRKFHSEEELPLVLISGEDLKQRLVKDPMFFYRATPIIAKEFMEQGYDLVIKMDADNIVMGDLSELWTGDEWDVAVVQNSNPKNYEEHLAATGQHLTVLDINPMHYVNAGLVAMQSKEFVDHWYNLCISDHFNSFTFKEQDLLNILVHYGNYAVKFLDASDKWYGLIAKGHESRMILKDKTIILPSGDSWSVDADKQIMVWHMAGGATKPNYKTKFQPDVVKYIDQLIKP